MGNKINMDLKKKIYLAGPDVFLPHPIEHGKKLSALCEEYGFEGLFPLDNVIEESDPLKLAQKIRVANIDFIDKCDIVIANLSPFRGPEPDSGTVFEVGYAMAKGKIVLGYSSNMNSLLEKTRHILQLDSNATRDNEELEIEDFGLTHNLMYAHCVVASNFEETLKYLKTNF